MVLGFYGSAANGNGFLAHPGSDYTRNDSAWINLGSAIPDNGGTLKMSTPAAGTSYYSINSLNSPAFANTVSAEAITLGKRYDDNALYNGQAYDNYWEYVLARKYASPEPTVTAGSEETYNYDLPAGYSANVSINTTKLVLEGKAAPNMSDLRLLYYNSSDSAWYELDRVNDGQDTLVGSWHFDEASGTTANDESGNGNTGTLINGAAFTHWGRAASGAAFDGVNDAVNVPDSGSINGFNSAITIEGWVKQSVAAGTQTIAERNSNYYLNVQDGKPCFYWYGLSSPGYHCTDSAMPLGSWVHVVATWNGAAVNLYIDGTLSKTVAGVTGTGTQTSPKPLGIGANTDASTRYFNGQIDEVKLYSRALSPAEVLSHYQAGIQNKAIYKGMGLERTNVWLRTQKNITAAGTDNNYWLYYGAQNPAAQKNNSNNIYLFYDDFDDNSLDAGKWTEIDNGNYISETNGQITSTGGTGAWTSNGLVSVPTFSRTTTGLLAEWDYKRNRATCVNSYDAHMFGWKDAGAGTIYSDLVYGYYAAAPLATCDAVTAYEDGTSRGTKTGTWFRQLWTKIRVIANSTATGGALYQQKAANQSSWTTSYSSSYSSETPLKLAFLNYNQTFTIDNVKIRRYVSPEPSSALAGSEQQNTASTPLAAGYSVLLEFNHAAYVSDAKSFANGSDFRIAYYNSSDLTWYELDRVNETAFNQDPTRIWFATQKNIPFSESDSDYWAYYNATKSVASEKNNGSNVYLFYDHFDGASLDSSKWAVTSGVLSGVQNSYAWVSPPCYRCTARLESVPKTNWTDTTTEIRVNYVAAAYKAGGLSLYKAPSQPITQSLGGTNGFVRHNIEGTGGSEYIRINTWTVVPTNVTPTYVWGSLRGENLQYAGNYQNATGNFTIWTGDDYGTNGFYLDYVKTRKYLPPDPCWNCR